MVKASAIKASVVTAFRPWARAWAVPMPTEKVIVSTSSGVVHWAIRSAHSRIRPAACSRDRALSFPPARAHYLRPKPPICPAPPPALWNRAEPWNPAEPWNLAKPRDLAKPWSLRAPWSKP